MLASLRSDISSFADAVGSFFDSLAQIGVGSLAVGLALFVVYLSIRSMAFYNVLRAAYPGVRIARKRVWGAYVAAYGFNNIVPARGGDIIKLFLVRSSIPGATYPAVGASLVPEMVFDLAMGSLILVFAFSQGVFPKPPDFADLNAFDLSFFAGHPRLTLFLLTAITVGSLVTFALLSDRARRFWTRVQQGLTILRDRRRFLREVFAVQFVAWCFRFAALWFLLDAFGVGGSVKNVLLVLGVNAVAAAVPFTPGGAGVQQALLVQVFAGAAATATVAAYSVGQQIAIAVTMLFVGFLALVFVFGFRSFREVREHGRADRQAAREGQVAEADAAERRQRKAKRG